MIVTDHIHTESDWYIRWCLPGKFDDRTNYTVSQRSNRRNAYNDNITFVTLVIDRYKSLPRTCRVSPDSGVSPETPH